MIDIARSLKTATVTGDVRLGLAGARKALGSGEAKLVVVSSNCPAKDEMTGQSSVRTIVFQGTNVELGAACGKPYKVSALAVVDQGESNILSA